MKEAPRILVVEDEEHLAEGIRYNLQAEGYLVTTVKDGPAALELLSNDASPFDLVVLDLMLPGMSGYAVCEELRLQRNDVPVLILSARSLAEDRTRGFAVGADQYMTKPFELDEFLSRVKSLLAMYSLRVSGVPHGSAFEFAKARVDFESFEVFVDGESARLTHLEMSLLEYFVKHEGRVLSRRELLENVWELPGQIRSRAPDQFIRRLRMIFEPEPARPRHFLTVRDVGYRFVSKPDEEGKPRAG